MYVVAVRIPIDEPGLPVAIGKSLACRSSVR